MKKIIALIAMLSVAFLASCSKEEVANEEAAVETPVVEVENTTNVEAEMKSEDDSTVEAEANAEAEMNNEVEAAIDMAEKVMDEISVEAEANTEAEMTK